MEVGPVDRGNDKREILRGVYEDNLRTVHRLAPSPGRRRLPDPPGPRTQVSLLSIVLLVVFAGIVYPSLPRSTASPSSWSVAEAWQELNPALSGGIMGNMAMLSILDHAEEESYKPAPTLASGSFSTPEFPLASLFNLQVKTIVIDPGHGGRDGGAVGNLGTREKDVTLDVGKRLKRRLEQKFGFRVLLTRENDTRISLRERVDFANERNADLFISLHVNYIPEEPLRVIETYYFGPQTDEETLALAEKENRESEYSIAEFNEMVQNMGSTVKLQESKRLATSIQKSLYRNISRINQSVSDWGVKSAPFVVLLGVQVPSVLAEIACISNRIEEEKLNTSEYREMLAAFLEEGIVNYLKQHSTHNESTERTIEYASKEK